MQYTVHLRGAPQLSQADRIQLEVQLAQALERELGSATVVHDLIVASVVFQECQIDGERAGEAERDARRLDRVMEQVEAEVWKTLPGGKPANAWFDLHGRR